MIVLLAAATLFAAPIQMPDMDGVPGLSEPLTLAMGPLASPRAMEPPDEDEGDLEEALIEPDFIVDNQKEIGLEEKQRNAIIDEIAKAQGDIVRSRWKLQASTSDLKNLLSADRIDETKALAKADEVMNLERDVKRANLAMLIRIKNQLTATQLKKLHDLRDEDEEMPFDRHALREMEKWKERAKKRALKDGEVPPVPPVHPAPPAPPAR